MPPAGFEHGTRAMGIGWRLAQVDEWLNAGSAMVWVIDPRRETIGVYRSAEDFTILSGDDTLDGGDVVAGFQCRVGDIFV